MSTLPTLDPLLHQPARTQISAYLAGRGEATFAELKRALAVTDGNLDAHLAKLLNAGYVESRRETPTIGRSQTVFSLTATGRRAFTVYVATLRVPAGSRVPLHVDMDSPLQELTTPLTT
jgi:predicted ArsR family transcriptional regulator